MKYRSLKHWKYELLEEMSCYVKIQQVVKNDYITIEIKPDGFPQMILKVHAHYAWDGPSGPTFDGPTNMRASLFHDALCQLIGERLLDKKYRKYADQLFHKHLLEDGMSKWRAWCYYKAVRGWSRLKGM